MPSKRTRRGLMSTLYSPFHQVFVAGENATGAITNTTRNVVKTAIRGVDRIGRSVTSHADSAVRGLVSRKGGRRGSRKSRRGGRRTRTRRSRR